MVPVGFKCFCLYVIWYGKEVKDFITLCLNSEYSTVGEGGYQGRFLVLPRMFLAVISVVFEY